MIARLATLFLIMALGSLHADARNFWLGREGLSMGKFGAAGSKGSNGVAPGCSGTSLSFTTPCNSMYLAVIH